MSDDLKQTVQQFAENVEKVRVALLPFAEQYMKAVHEFAVKARELTDNLPKDSQLRKALEDYVADIEEQD